MKPLNEYSLLMHLLTRATPGTDTTSQHTAQTNLQYGCDSDELCKKLKFTGKSAKLQLSQLMTGFSEDIRPFGLVIRQNPFNGHWYVTQDAEIQNYFLNNPFDNKIRLGYPDRCRLF